MTILTAFASWVSLFGLSVFCMKRADMNGIIDMDTESIVIASAFVAPFAIMFVLAMTLAQKLK